MRFTLLAICLLLLFSGSLYALNMDDLVLHLSFDGEGHKDAEDVSGNGNDAEFMGKVNLVDAQYGKGIHIAEGGPNGVTIKSSDTLQISGPMTIACWFNIVAMPEAQCAIIIKPDSFMINLATWSQKPPWKREGQVQVEPCFRAGGEGNFMTPASVPVPLGEWHHIVVVYDGKELLNYIDGELKGSWAKEGPIPVNPNPMFISGDSRGGVPPPNGAELMLDELLIFNRAVSADEVKEIMAAAWLSVQAKHRLIGSWGATKRGY